jgi:hypothetical protein
LGLNTGVGGQVGEAGRWVTSECDNIRREREMRLRRRVVKIRWERTKKREKIK